MRTLLRNKQKFYYANYDGENEIIDDNGFLTGEFEKQYTFPKVAYGNISSSKGSADVELFGTQVQYDKAICIDNVNTEIDEHSVLWIDCDIENDYNYVVVRVARSLNSVLLAIRQVDVQ